MLECLIATCSYSGTAYTGDFGLRTLTVEHPVDNRCNVVHNAGDVLPGFNWSFFIQTC